MSHLRMSLCPFTAAQLRTGLGSGFRVQGVGFSDEPLEDVVVPFHCCPAAHRFRLGEFRSRESGLDKPLENAFVFKFLF